MNEARRAKKEQPAASWKQNQSNNAKIINF